MTTLGHALRNASEWTRTSIISHSTILFSLMFVCLSEPLGYNHFGHVSHSCVTFNILCSVSQVNYFTMSHPAMLSTVVPHLVANALH